MEPPKVTRAQLKAACDQQHWDLLDKLLELDPTHINDSALYTDTWGEWWGLLIECIRAGHTDGVRVLLKHGADRTAGTWGDCIPLSPLEAAQAHPAILALLLDAQPPAYTRASDPPIPPETAQDRATNRQGDIRDQTGLVFPSDAFQE